MTCRPSIVTTMGAEVAVKHLKASVKIRRSTRGAAEIREISPAPSRDRLGETDEIRPVPEIVFPLAIVSVMAPSHPSQSPLIGGKSRTSSELSFPVKLPVTRPPVNFASSQISPNALGATATSTSTVACHWVIWNLTPVGPSVTDPHSRNT